MENAAGHFSKLLETRIKTVHFRLKYSQQYISEAVKKW